MRKSIWIGIGIVTLAALLLFSLLLSFADPIFRKSAPSASKGAVDLSGWDFARSGSVSLNGQWEWYEGQLLTPADFAGAGTQKPKLTGYADLTAGLLGGASSRSIPPMGVRTYRLVVQTSPQPQNYGLVVDNIRMSNRLFVDGVPQGGSGTVALRGDGYEGKTQSYTAYFRPQGPRLEILLQTANYEFPFYGTQYKLILGTQESVGFSSEIAAAIEISGAILSFLLAFLYLCLLVANKRAIGFLFAAFEFFSFTVALLVLGDRLLYSVFPAVSPQLFAKLNALCLLAAVVSVIAYTNAVEALFLPRLFTRAAYGLSGAYFALVLLTPYAIYVRLEGVRDVFLIFVLLFFLIKLCVAYRRHEDGLVKSARLLNGFCVGTLLITFGNNFLYDFCFVPVKAVGSTALCAFYLLSAAAIGFRFFENYRHMVRMGNIRDEFLTRISYELQAPLNGIRLLCESVLSGEARHDGGEPARSYADIRAMTERLLRIVDTAKDITLLQNGQFELHVSPVDLAACASLAAERARFQVQGRHIDILTDFETSCAAWADESRVRQILAHLADNAAGNMERGTIRISGRKKGFRVVVVVEDTGCGIPKTRWKEIFQPYRSLSGHGIGIGLYLSRLLAERMGGTLTLEWSEPGKGSRFCLTLPASDPAVFQGPARQLGAMAFQRSGVPKGGAKKGGAGTVLVVDDELVNIQTASFILHRNGYSVLTALSGEEALKKIESFSVDLAIVDVSLPGSSGIAVCRDMRRDHSILELPVLLANIGKADYDLELGMDAGANDFIPKPFEEKELLARVGTLITMKKSIENALRSELAFLQAQIKPHFVYNAINTIVSFCYTDGERAAKLLTDFSKYLRMTFDVEKQTYFKPLRREIEMIRAYMEIEQARFGDKIRIEYDIDGPLLDCGIPALIIQPLVENAVRHGLCPKADGGLVTVSVHDRDGVLSLVVSDTGVGMPSAKLAELNGPARRPGGVGIANVNQRIRRWKNARMDIRSLEGCGTTVSITVSQYAGQNAKGRFSVCEPSS